RTREAFVFVSSPDAVTPYHIDHECNFLLQIVGTKTVRMLPPNDPTVIQEADLERFYAGGSRNLLRLDSQTEAKASTFELTPGLGLHFPVTAPHWVKNGPAVSISFSITFRTSHSDRREILYRINHKLRTLGLDPTPVGRSQSSDNIKYGLFNAARTLVKAVRPNGASSQQSGSRYSNGR
ncbi:MAG TPA: cupin-like domain-containing protein, partial [Pseudolabrys sp.]|nr:cupin-like domain-containing protein [Pseudolabrys sp.]